MREILALAYVTKFVRTDTLLLATIVAIVACIFNGPIIDYIGKKIVNLLKLHT